MYVLFEMFGAKHKHKTHEAYHLADLATILQPPENPDTLFYIDARIFLNMCLYISKGGDGRTVFNLLLPL